MNIFQTPEQAELAKEHAVMIADCMKHESKLSQWEADFIQSLSEQIEDENFIQFSTGQLNKLDQIWNKATD